MGDLISRQAVEDITWEEPSYSDPLNVLTEVRDKVRALPPVENKGEWIPVSERLPKERQAVLCWAESTAERLDAEFIGMYDNGVWFLQSDANHLSYPHQYNVVAWQPLPEPYKKGGE